MHPILFFSPFRFLGWLIHSILSIVAGFFMLLWKGLLGVLAFVFRLFGSDLFNVPYRLRQLDDLDGIDFEEACVKLLQHNGFYDVQRTPNTGDFGIDILATYREERIAIQCKRYIKNIDNSAVQEAAAGKVYYDVDFAAVLTNSHFTQSAYDLAEKNEVLLWDREDLVEMLRKNFQMYL